MADVMAPFSIHQELWQDCWVAATSAVRARKKLVDYVISRRVTQLLTDYGPESAQPLTLRVYGTMLKGFCVLNNEQAKALYSDCERIVIAFAQQPYADGSAVKLPVAKRQRVDALTLDLDISKVQESEQFDWGPAPVEDGALLHLHLEPAPLEEPAQEFMPEMALLRLPCLPEQVPLLDEAFPALETAPPESSLLPVETIHASGADAPAAADNIRADLETLVALGAAPEPPMQGSDDALVVPRPLMLVRRPRGVSLKPLGPGVVYGFDEQTQLAPELYTTWMEGDADISLRQREPADYVEALPSRAARMERLGRMVDIVDPALAGIADARTQHAVPCEQLLPLAEQQPQMPGPSAHVGQEAGTARQTSLLEFFRPYVPEAPLASTAGAGEELARILAPQGGGGDESLAETAAVGYDASAVQVGRLLHSCLAQSANEHRGLTLDDVLPASSTSKAVAARAFAAVLTLATAGDFCAEQLLPYGTIGISAR